MMWCAMRMQDIFNISTLAASSGRIMNNPPAFAILPLNGPFWWHLSPSSTDPILADTIIVCDDCNVASPPLGMSTVMCFFIMLD